MNDSSGLINPELPPLLRDWSREILRYQPDDIIAFSRDYFMALYNDGVVSASQLNHTRGSRSHVGRYAQADEESDATFVLSSHAQFAEPESPHNSTPSDKHALSSRQATVSVPEQSTAEAEVYEQIVHALNTSLSTAVNESFNNPLIDYSRITQAQAESTSFASKLHIVQKILPNLISLATPASNSNDSPDTSASTPSSNTVDSFIIYSLMKELANHTSIVPPSPSSSADITAPISPAAAPTAHSAALEWFSKAPARMSMDEGLSALTLASASMTPAKFVNSLASVMCALPGATVHNTDILNASSTSRDDDGSGGKKNVPSMLNSDNILDFDVVDSLANDPSIAEEDMMNMLLSKRLHEAVADAERTLRSLAAILEKTEVETDASSSLAVGAGADDIEAGVGVGVSVGTDTSNTTTDDAVLHRVLDFDFNTDTDVNTNTNTSADADIDMDSALATNVTRALPILGEAISARQQALERVFSEYSAVCEAVGALDGNVTIPTHDAVMLVNNLSRDTITQQIIKRFQRVRKTMSGGSSDNGKLRASTGTDASTDDTDASQPIFDSRDMSLDEDILSFVIHDNRGDIDSAHASSSDFIRYAYDKTRSLTQAEFFYALSLMKQRYRVVNAMLAPKTSRCTRMFLDLDVDMVGCLPAFVCRDMADKVLDASAGLEEPRVYSDYMNNDAVLYLDNCADDEPVDLTTFTLYMLAKCGHIGVQAFDTVSTSE